MGKQHLLTENEKDSLAFERGFRYGLAKCLRIIDSVREGRKSHNEKMALKLAQVHINELTHYNEKKQIL